MDADHPENGVLIPCRNTIILIFGLGLSIAMMGVAASFIARLLQTHRWIAYVGLAVILYVAGEMVFRGTLDVIKVASI
ncbi:putative tellurium resistance membrane protein TerC [Bradyrhizobium japonicum]